jgi:hypothetical protein
MGQKRKGGFDGFVSKHDPTGKHLWTRQLGSKASDQGQAIAVDQRGNVLVTGWTAGSINGENAGDDDVYLAKYDASGNLAWTYQLGSKSSDKSYAVTTDANEDIFLSGSTGGDLDNKNSGASDAFVAKISSSGKQVWVRQFGSSGIDIASGAVVDQAGNVFISGHTQGKLAERNFGGMDVFIAKFDTNGNQKFIRQFGTPDDDSSFDLDIDAFGNLYTAGGTHGDLRGKNSGTRDAFLAMLNAEGNVVTKNQLGTSQYDNAMAVAAADKGGVFLVGETGGLFGKPDVLEDSDGFVAKFQLEKPKQPEE